MIQVPSFGMENNPASLMARRKAFLTSYGYGPLDVEGHVEDLTEVIGHVPSVVSYDTNDYDRYFGSGGRVEMTFYSTVTPYTRAWVRQDEADALAFAMDMERSGLWTLAKVSEAN